MVGPGADLVSDATDSQFYECSGLLLGPPDNLLGPFVSVDIGNLDMIVIWSLEFVW